MGLDAAAGALELSGISRIVPTDMLFGETSGFAARKSSCEILNCSASSLNVSPDFMVYAKGVEVGIGVSTMTSTFGAGVRLGVAVRYGSSEELFDAFCGDVDAQAVIRNAQVNIRLRIR